MKNQTSVFDLLANPIKKTLAEFGFTEPTLPKTLSVPVIYQGRNVLLIAPTGSGKTEEIAKYLADTR